MVADGHAAISTISAIGGGRRIFVVGTLPVYVFLCMALLFVATLPGWWATRADIAAICRRLCRCRRRPGKYYVFPYHFVIKRITTL